MTRTNSNIHCRLRLPRAGRFFKNAGLALLVLGSGSNLMAGESEPSQKASAVAKSAGPESTNEALRFDVRAYVIEDTTLIPTNNLRSVFSNYTGSNLGLNTLLQAAAELEADYRQRGFPTVGIAMGQPEASNGVVTLRVFQGVFSQILISGKRYNLPGSEMAIEPNVLVASPAGTNAAKPLLGQTKRRQPRPLTPEEEALEKSLHSKMAELAAAEKEASLPPVDNTPPPVQLILAPTEKKTATTPQEALHQKMAELAGPQRRARLFPNSATNSLVSGTNVQTLEVKGYELIGNTLLPSDLTELILQPYTGTNISFDLIRRGLTELQTVYRDRGFATVSVGLPPQKLTNGIVKVRVFEGRLLQVLVENNYYFSSNNIMRALPSLHNNMILTSPVFQAELDRANANQDRQIYPVIEPGPREKTTLLRLTVKDQLPLHAKVEFNNQSSPGTPDFRLNSSAMYNNLWDLEHSIGIQYGFSPEIFKAGSQWDWYDRPLVANYSAFYRMPLGNQDSLDNIVTTQQGSFGYDEATRKFNLPKSSGRPELNIYASRATIDTGLETLSTKNILNQPQVRTITEQDVQQDITINQNVGFRLSTPLPEAGDWRSLLAGGLDYKTYERTGYKTNNFLFSEFFPRPDGSLQQRNFTLPSAQPPTHTPLDYLPFSLRYDASLPGAAGTTIVGLGISVNLWHSGSSSNLHGVVGSNKSSGNWVTLTPSFSHDFNLRTNWTLSLHADGQWASEPLISNEQFGAGGVASVRGYQEGEVFGDTGWRGTIELKTPPHLVGLAYGRANLTLRGSVYMDYAETYLLDPQGRADRIPLWGVGMGWVALVGTHWEARFLFSVPLERTATTSPFQPRFNFALTGQF